MNFDTLILHGGTRRADHLGASSVPIYQASTFHQEEWGKTPFYEYARSGNPTRCAVEQLIAELEGAQQGFAFASGIAAVTSVLLTLASGDHVIASTDLYGGTYRALTRVFSRLGITTTFVDTAEMTQIASAICPNTRMLLLETPSNPTLQITDLHAAIQLAKAHQILTVVDNTFMSPYLAHPHRLGADVVVHSGTKFLGGHSDVVAGLITVNCPQLQSDIYLIQNGLGAVLGPHDSWLLMRGMKTLPIRMRQSQASALKLAHYLQSHPKISNVYYPGLTSHPGHAVHNRQADGPGAVLSFELTNAAAVRALVEHLQLPLFAVSLGAVETILSYPSKMSHAAMPEQERLARGITDGLLRLSVGIEATEDLLSDFETALQYV